MEACSYCGASALRKNGMARNGKQRYHCRACGRSRRSAPGPGAYSEARKAEIRRAYQERTSLRRLTRIFGVCRQTVTTWLNKSPPPTAAGPKAGPAAAP